jgi:hypothetical protein
MSAVFPCSAGFASEQGMIRRLIGVCRSALRTEAPEAARERLAEAVAEIQRVNAEIPGKLAIRYRDSGPWLYPDSTPADYAALVACGRGAKRTWHDFGLSPDQQPRYEPIRIEPSDVIDSELLLNHWVVAYYLIYRP